MLFRKLLLKFFRKSSMDSSFTKNKYVIECLLYNFYAVIWLIFTIYVWVSWHRKGILFKVIATIIDVFGIPVGLTDTWSYKKWLREEEKLKEGKND